MNYSLHVPVTDILPRNTIIDTLSTPLKVQDFKTLKLSFGTDADADFDIVVYGSYNPPTTPPNLAIAAGIGNEYHLLGYTDESDGVNYAGSAPYNPTSNAVVKGFNIECTGITWIVVGIDNLADGTLTFMNVDLFSNHT